MRTSSQRRPKERLRQSGYALLMVIFMVATIMLFAVAATPSVLIEGRRALEQEDVWRGNQYVRAIRLYYQKTGRYPQTVDDLMMPDVNGNHYLRKTYSDLLNPVDGKWRFIYVSPSGQLIGSVRYHSLQEMAAAQGIGASLGTVAGGAGSAGVAMTTTATAAAGQTAQTPGQAGQQTPGAGAGSTPLFGASAQPQSLAPLEPVDGPVLGGFLIGVGGKTKTPSLMVYQGGKTYYEWEFIWNPLASGIAIGQPTVTPGAAPNGTNAPNGTTAPNGTAAPNGAAAPNGTAAPAGGAPAGTPPDANATPGNPPDSNSAPGTPPANAAPGNPPANPAQPNPDGTTNPPADPNAPAAPAPNSTQ